MTTLIKVAAATVNQIPLDWKHNRDNLLAVLKEANKQGVKVLCCPELAITGYGCEDAFLSSNTCRMALSVLTDLIPHTKNMFVGFGLPLLYKNILYNVVAAVADGKLLGFVAKQHLPGYGLHYEPRWFTPWPKGKIADCPIENHAYPLGDVIFHFEDLRLGFEICEDAWVPERTGIDLSERGVDLILNPSASHFAFYKYPLRLQFVLEGAKRFKVVYLYANLSGNEAGRIIYDGDTLISTPEGLVAVGPRFSFKEFGVTSTTIDLTELRSPRAIEKPALQQAEWPPHSSPNIDPLLCNNTHLSGSYPAWEMGQYVKEEEFSRAVALGLFDYLRKSRSQGFALSLSGGSDSSSCASLVYLMVKFALLELGEAEFRKKLSHIPLPQNPAEFMQALLFCLYQKTKNNSEATETAAAHVAKALGASYASLAIDDLVENYCQRVTSLFKDPISWEKNDLALQNIQARVRSPSIWLAANLKGALLLTTSNRSEAAVGYTTMDGDTSGCLAPIAGVSKSFIQTWLRWLEQSGPEGIGSLPVLKYVLALSPSAELRPLEEKQTDEGDLMPYAWLDTIERLFVLEKLAPLTILQILEKHFPDEAPETLAKAIERFCRLWSRSQWKRERLAPSFHLDIEDIDSRTWCRYPILSQDFSLEIEEMWKSILISS